MTEPTTGNLATTTPLQPGLNQVSPQTTFNEQVIAAEIKADKPLAQQAIADAQKKDIPALVELYLKNKGLIRDEITQAESLISQIKAGWAEPALWVVLGFMAFNVFCIIKGIPIDIKEDSGLGALVLGYLGHRHQMTK